MTTDSKISVRIESGRNGLLPDVKSVWDQCLANAPEHQQLFGYGWYAAWMRHLANTDGWTGDSRILIASDESGRPLGILPLAGMRKRGLRFWALAGYFQPVRGLVCVETRQNETCEALARALLRMQRWNEFLRFGPYNTAYPERLALLDALNRLCRRLVCFKGGATIVARNVPDSPDAYHGMVQSSSSMKRIRSYERRMEREGEARIEHFHTPEGETLKRMLQDISCSEKRSWVAGEGGFPRFTPGNSLAFWEQVCADQLVPKGQLDAWIAYFNGEPVAFRYTLTVGTTRYLIANQYVEQFAQYRLGWILYLRDMEDCAQRGVRAIDMGSGDLHYKSRWGGVEEAVDQNILILPPGPLGVLGAQLMRIQPIYERAKKIIGS